MTKADTFKRLPAKRRGVIRRASIWDAGEYLLSISGTAFSEQYRRFYYRDIQAIVVQKGPRVGSIGALVFLGFCTLILANLMAIPNRPLVLSWLWTVPLAAWLLLLLLNLTRGCRVFVFTAVSSEELPAIFQRSALHRVLPHILGKIRKAQGSFTDTYTDASATPELQQIAPLHAEWVTTPRSALYTALIYFLVVLAGAGFAFWYRDAALTPESLAAAKILFCMLNALGVASGVWALVKVFRIQTMASLRTTIFAGLGLMLARTYALLFAFSASKVQGSMLSDSMTGIHWRQGLGKIDCALSAVIAISGLIFLAYAWQDDRQGSSSRGSLSGS